MSERQHQALFFAAGALLNVRSTAVFQPRKAANTRVSQTHFAGQSIELTRWLIRHGADPNARCAWDITPLSAAICRGSLSTIKLMLQCGGDTRFGQLLHFAVERGSPDQLAIIDMLLAFGLSVNARMFENCRTSWTYNKPYGMGTALHKAAELGKLDVVTYLLERGADPLNRLRSTFHAKSAKLSDWGSDSAVVELKVKKPTPSRVVLQVKVYNKV
ncbi:uncharacterized protein MYCFIDRAFT_177167 [Pseudocercospora fijiensis CIRAD86]|uniref:Uncharacterized protein n=1 Tax=Pseudocercospora fijiensis (strain CIRAD86) TaxID=383855 RepID=M2ZMA3_PSEFD|nr:uncharacterized protein MYCFIDRAFT_177167 [Pseudocercospora fijiensis CIRAD86]EME80199.1 hypothetical protein MYCFIDRAFT_177167 [Pseudocercospora fijiensis CIRAD86]